MATTTKQKATEPRKRAAHLGPERRRPELLDAALRLFLDRGYDGTSMQAVADQAGVTKPVVYAAFESKDDLFRALLAREEERILAEIQGAFENADLSDPETTLIEGFTGFLRAVGDSPEVYKLIFLGEGGGNAAVARRIQRGRQAQVDALSLLAKRWLDADGGSGPPTRRRPACSATRSRGWPRPAPDCCSPARTAGRRRRSVVSWAASRPRSRRLTSRSERDWARCGRSELPSRVEAAALVPPGGSPGESPGTRVSLPAPAMHCFSR